uniref:Uncharacterized protein n=1 Tax=Arundo donax TaxID=35708 RepID=A0A0A9AA73_ARUDO
MGGGLVKVFSGFGLIDESDKGCEQKPKEEKKGEEDKEEEKEKKKVMWHDFVLFYHMCQVL